MFSIKFENKKYLIIDVESGEVGVGSKKEAMVFGSVAGAEEFALKNGYEEFEIEVFY